MPSLEASGNARVVTVSSLGHRRALLDLDWVDDPQLELKKYDPWRAYGIAKLSNIFFAKELNARYGKSGIQAFSVHPGRIKTNLQAHMDPLTTFAFTVCHEEYSTRSINVSVLCSSSKGC